MPTAATNNPPAALAIRSKQRVCEVERVISDGSNSYDPDNGDSIVSYRWSVEERDDEDNRPRIADPNSVKTAVETRNTLNSDIGSVGIELDIVDKSGTVSYDLISFRIEKCNDKWKDDKDDNRGLSEKIKVIESITECNIISKTINYTGQLAPNGVRIIGFFDQCKLDN